MSDTVRAYHFLSPDGTAYGGYRPAPVGSWEPEIPNPVLCERGYHGSVRLLDALQYATGPILQRCEYQCVIYGDDKLVGTSRRALARADATALLRTFAARCAEEALALVANPDPRSVAACVVARRHALGLATDEELAAARAAAWAAAWAAVRADVRADVRDATWADVRADVRDATWAAAWDAQNSWLESACMDLDWCEVPHDAR